MFLIVEICCLKPIPEEIKHCPDLYYRRINRLGRAWAKNDSSSDNPSVYKYGQADGSSWITRQDGWSVAVYKCRNKTNYPRRLHLVTRSQLPASINYKNGLKAGRVTRHTDSLSHSPSRIYTRRMILLHGWSVWTSVSSINRAIELAPFIPRN